MSMIRIYTLADPITNEIRYIGLTKKTLEERLKGHLKCKDKTHRTFWINSIKNKGLKPKIELLDEVENELGPVSEIFWISMFKTWGFKLVNLTDGGETSTTKNIIRSKEWCENIRKGKLKSNFKYTIESKQKMSESAKKRGINSKGEQISKLKLTDNQVKEIKGKLKNRNGKTLKLLSKELSLPYTFLVDLNTNRIWKHIQ